MASRALVTLHWAVQGSTELMQVLIKIAHTLLVGHVMDPALEMSQVLSFGLPAVLSALSQSESHPSDRMTTTCLRHLACLFLRRVAIDRPAFSSLYGRCTHRTVGGEVLIGRVRSGPAEALWSLLGKHLLYTVLPAVLVISKLALRLAGSCTVRQPHSSAVALCPRVKETWGTLDVRSPQS